MLEIYRFNKNKKLNHFTIFFPFDTIRNLEIDKKLHIIFPL